MKKFLAILGLCLFLGGCASQQTFETLLDAYDVSVMAEIRQVELALPEDAVITTIEQENVGKLYLCDGYNVAVQTMESGDLNKTLYETTGFEEEQLAIMKTKRGEVTRYDYTWCAAGEAEEQICRGVLLDDGSYHYVVTVMADASKAGDLTATWQHILDSAKLVSTD